MNIKFNKYIKLLRPKHYLKNLLIFLPLIFSGLLFDKQYFFRASLSFVAFCLVASFVYIINDIRDLEQDKLHEKKKNRPISSGEVTVKNAIKIAIILLIGALVIQYFANPSLVSYLLLFIYILMNLFYSLGLKNIPIVDVAILSFGFLIRIFYGGDSVGIQVSEWLYLAVLSFSFYMGLGKRRNEISTIGTHTRKVNKFYNHDFLDKNMYMCLGLTIVFYSLWTVDSSQIHKIMIWTVPLVLIILMTYSLSIERNDSDGDPINVLTGNKLLFILVICYILLITSIVYIF